MVLTSNDISHLGRLARLKLTDEEISRYRKEIAGILRYVDQLPAQSKMKTKPRTAMADFELREDIIETWNEGEKQAALSEAPAREKKQIKVKRILA